jgi:TatA/E family protein of Tat protein translocase
MDIVIILLLILLVVLLWRGPKTLPKLGESLGDAIRSIRRATNEPPDAPNEPAANPNAQAPEPREDERPSGRP